MVRDAQWSKRGKTLEEKFKVVTFEEVPLLFFL